MANYYELVPPGHSWIFTPGETYVQPISGTVVVVDPVYPFFEPKRERLYWDWYTLRWTIHPPKYIVDYMNYYMRQTAIYRVTGNISTPPSTGYSGMASKSIDSLSE